MFGLKYLKNVSTLELIPANCTGCGMCTIVCPQQILQLYNKKVQILDKNNCMECGACQRNCETDAIRVKAGVGCAAAVIQGALRGTEPTCDCGSADSNANCC